MLTLQKAGSYEVVLLYLFAKDLSFIFVKFLFQVYILKSLTELTKEVDRLKKADDKFLLEKSHPTTARLYANKLVQTVNNGMQKRITYDVKQFQTRKLQNLIDKLIGFMKKKII